MSFLFLIQFNSIYFRILRLLFVYNGLVRSVKRVLIDIGFLSDFNQFNVIKVIIKFLLEGSGVNVLQLYGKSN